MSKEVIAVDLDDVLASHYEVLADFMNERYGHNHGPAEYSSSLAALWGVDQEEAVRRMWEFHDMDILGTFPVKPEAVSAIARLEDNYNFAVVTARPKRSVEATHAWLDQYFPSVFQQIAFIHPWEGDPATKADKCLELDANYLIDDTLQHCRSAAEADINALLFGVHERTDDIPREITPVYNWQEVENYFDGRS